MKKFFKNVFALFGMSYALVATFWVLFNRVPNFLEGVALAIFQALVFIVIWGGLTD